MPGRRVVCAVMAAALVVPDAVGVAVVVGGVVVGFVVAVVGALEDVVAVLVDDVAGGALAVEEGLADVRLDVCSPGGAAPSSPVAPHAPRVAARLRAAAVVTRPRRHS